MLTRLVSASFDAAVRGRGRGYDAQRRVTILSGSEDTVVAAVRGTDRYVVRLQARDGVLNVTCTCPYLGGGSGPCKHVWATVLESDRRGHLGLLAQRRGAIAVVVRAPSLGEPSVDDDELEERPPVSLARRPTSHSFEARHIVRSVATAVMGARGRLDRHVVRPSSPPWQASLRAIHAAVRDNVARASGWQDVEVSYVIDVAKTLAAQRLVVEISSRAPKKNGEPGAWKELLIAPESVTCLSDASDRRLLPWLVGGERWDSYGGEYIPSRAQLTSAVYLEMLPDLCRTGRCRIRRHPEDSEMPVLEWDPSPPWALWIEADPAGTGHIELRGSLRRDTEKLDLMKPHLLLPGGVVFWERWVGRLLDTGIFPWVVALRKHGILRAPLKQAPAVLDELFSSPAELAIELSPDLGFCEVPASSARAYAVVRPPPYEGRGWLEVEAGMEYDGIRVQASKEGSFAVDADAKRVLRRDRTKEARALELVRELGARPAIERSHGEGGSFQLAANLLPKFVRALVQAGWHVEAEGKACRNAKDFRLNVTSGTDWLDLEGVVDFDGASVAISELLAALRRGATTVALDDGTVGMLPEEWLKKWGVVLDSGQAVGERLRFRRGQAALLDVLLADEPHVTCDAAFSRLRAELSSFDGIRAESAPAAFAGKLREYQRHGLGWMSFLRRFGFGGCLADDMGLGKTVQVLAMLCAVAGARASRSARAASLIVVPRSLVFNWLAEAKRFAPSLNVLDHTGVDREEPGVQFRRFDVILTTYGTLRRDIEGLRAIEFEYVILDEANAIKNAESGAAKAARLLRARHRLALTGTPIENHLGELWSLFEFLNPGMLGASTVFRRALSDRDADEPTRALLGRALRPFILRRTKSEVAPELPPRVEQTIHCDLDRAERTFYDELRDHYRQSLGARVARDGIGKSTAHILEALLRLRQAACHPGLVDKKRAAASSTKLDILYEQLATVRAEGQKALVFSQFTSLLSILKRRLDAEDVDYEYLDGQTRDRQAPVDRFQRDPECGLFLVSLKAGGVGLNLTAAEYVFLLDPWWNPAVEAQAIDRAHRMGQTRAVFGYRLIARGTVEEKVAELQKSKRALADAILGDGSGGFRGLTRDDLEVLLS